MTPPRRLTVLVPLPRYTSPMISGSAGTVVETTVFPVVTEVATAVVETLPVSTAPALTVTTGTLLVVTVVTTVFGACCCSSVAPVLFADRSRATDPSTDGLPSARTIFVPSTTAAVASATKLAEIVPVLVTLDSVPLLSSTPAAETMSLMSPVRLAVMDPELTRLVRVDPASTWMAVAMMGLDIEPNAGIEVSLVLLGGDTEAVIVPAFSNETEPDAPTTPAPKCMAVASAAKAAADTVPVTRTGPSSIVVPAVEPLMSPPICTAVAGTLS